jgi:putative oxidoreductase
MNSLHADSLALLALRAFVGVAFILHGYGKIQRLRDFAAAFGLPHFVAIFVLYAQLVGGALLVVGLLTPVASLAIAVTMAGAVVKCRGRGERFIDPTHHSWESAGFYLVTSVVLAVLGPGGYSLDAVLF